MNRALSNGGEALGASRSEGFSSVSTSDPCQHAASLRGWSQDYLQLSAGAFHGEIVEATTGPVQVFLESIDQRVDEKASPRRDSYTIGIPIDVREGGYWQGYHLERDSLMTLRPNEELHFRTPDYSSILVTVIDCAALDELAATAGVEIPSLIPRRNAVPLNTELARRYRAALSEALTCSITTPEVLKHEASRKAIAESVMSASLSALSARHESRERACGGHAVQRAIVERARSYVLANREKAPTVTELSAHLKMSRRGLHHAFMNVLGINAATFLRYVRLHGARKDLLRAAPSESVSSIACRWGFWHMGMFSCYYKALFGETPSATLRQPPRLLGTSPLRPN